MQRQKRVAVSSNAKVIVLRKITHNDIVNDLVNGKFSTLSINNLVIDKASSGSIISNIGTSKDDAVRSFYDCEGVRVVVATSGYEEMIMYHRDRSYDPVRPCDWCRQTFDGVPVRIPISCKIVKTERDNVESVIHVMQCDGRFCTYGCAKSHLVLYKDDPLYLKSDTYLRFAHNLETGQKTLTPAKDWRLLKSNGGSLDSRDWYDNKIYDRSITQVLMVPTAVAYIRRT